MSATVAATSTTPTQANGLGSNPTTNELMLIVAARPTAPSMNRATMCDFRIDNGVVDEFTDSLRDRVELQGLVYG